MSLDAAQKLFISTNEKLSNVKYFIICDGKSGSTTLYNSFRKNTAIHAHTTAHFQKKTPQADQLGITLRTMQDWSHQKFHRPPLIICSIREPIGRTVSSYFQNFRTHNPKKTPTAADICSQLEQLLPTLENYHSWDAKEDFDDLDILSLPFDTEIGHSFYETDRIRLLILKFEKIETWPETILRYLDQSEKSDFRFTPSNLSSGKSYNNLYRKVLGDFKPSIDTLDKKFEIQKETLEHFYTKAEIEIFKLRWYSKVIAPS